LLGAGNFDKCKFVGPYKVGVRYFHMKSKDTEVMCMYPIDQDEYDAKIRT